MKSESYQFFSRFLIYVLPLAILCSFPVFKLYQSGESFRFLDKELEAEKKHLIGYKYDESNYFYLKWKSLAEGSNKKVWILGASRVMQFRANMFEAPCYNGGYTILTVSDFYQFISSIPKEKYPEYLMMGMDQCIFNLKWSKYIPNRDQHFWKESKHNVPKEFFTYNSCFKDLIGGVIPVGKLSNYPDDLTRIGLSAHLSNTGIRNDGSMYYGELIEKKLQNDSSLIDHGFRDSFDRIEKGYGTLDHGDKADSLALKEISDLLEFCNVNNIKVIGYLPPFAESVYQQLKKSEKHNYLNELGPILKDVFTQSGNEFYDFTNPAAIQSVDKDFLDGMHGGEVTCQKLLLTLLKSGSILNNVADSTKLIKDMEKRINSFQIYPH